MSPRERRRAQKYSKRIGTKPFSGRRFVEHGAVRIEWWQPVRGADGKTRRKRRARTIGPNTDANRDYADKVLEEGLTKARAAAEGKEEAKRAASISLGDLFDQYLADARIRRSARTGQPLRVVTLDNYEKHIAQLRAAFDPARPAAELRRVEVRQLMQRLRTQGWAEGTIARLLDFLLMVYKWAVVEAELLEADPIHGVRRPSRKGTAGAYSPEESRRLLDALQSVTTWGSVRNESAAWRFRGAMLLQAAYAPRASQVRLLRWDDVDLDAVVKLRTPEGAETFLQGTVTFRQATEGSKGQPDRVVPMLRPVREAMLEAHNRNKDARSPWVFFNWRDHREPMSDDGPRRSLRTLEQRAGVAQIKGRGFHAMRRALMTALVEELGPSQAAAWMADTVKVITGTYVKPSDEAKAEAAQVAVRRLG